MQAVFYWTYVARHLCCCFDADPSLRQQYASSDDQDGELHTLVLSQAQEAQIREIFDLFDTDGGGTIDRGELDFAMVALGFHSKNRQREKLDTAEAAMEAIAADGTVTPEEFSALMMGELSGRDPKDTLRLVFALLSRADGDGGSDGVITKGKLRGVCDEFKVGSTEA